MGSPLDRLDREETERLRRRDQPSFTAPMLAKLTHDPFSDPAWIFERKLDGERCLAFGRGDRVELRSRNDKDLSGTYPEIVSALQKGPQVRFIIDGEVVAFRDSVTSFERLQQRMKIRDPDEARKMARRVAVYYYVFDILYLDGADTTGLSLRHRKSLLKNAFKWRDPLRYTPHRTGDGLEYYRAACRKGWEGIIAKKADTTYLHRRSGDWLKFKCVHRQEFVIGGYTDPGGERIGFGALLIGYYQGGELRYAGKVGTGFDDETLRGLGSRLEDLEVDEPPFSGAKIPSKGVHWVRPQLVGEFGYTELTREKRLRHPRFLGLRRDKEADEVVLEDQGG